MTFNAPQGNPPALVGVPVGPIIRGGSIVVKKAWDFKQRYTKAQQDLLEKQNNLDQQKDGVFDLKSVLFPIDPTAVDVPPMWLRDP